EGLLAVWRADQRNESGAVQIVFEPLNDSRRVILRPLEIDDPVAPFVTAATVARRDTAGIVAPDLLPQALGQCLDRLAFPQFATIDNDEMALRRGGRVKGFQRHRFKFPWSRRCASLRPA